MGRYSIRVSKQYFDFSCGHFLLFADRTREPLHGHNYRCEVEFEGTLSEDDMVLNYIHVKKMIKRICDELNHRTLLPLKNPDLRVWRDGGQVGAEYHDGSKFSFPAQDVILLDVHNTSTEMISVHVARRIVEELRKTGADGKAANEGNPAASKRITSLRVGIEEAPGQMSWYETAV